MARRGEAELNSAEDESEEVMRELDAIKRESSQLKMVMASISEEKRRADEEKESSSSKAKALSMSIETIKKEIEDVNEEHVLVELARIEAVKEYGEIEAKRKDESERHSLLMEEARKKKEQIIRHQQIEDEREMETKLAHTKSDVNLLESELQQVKETHKQQERNEVRSDIHEGDEDSLSLLESVMEEFEDVKKDLASVQEECFQFMTLMDVVRTELNYVMEEKARYKRKEDKAERIIQNLNAKLLRTNKKQEAISAAEDKAKSIVSNLELSLEKLKSETDTAKKERSLISEEAANIKAEVQRAETEKDEAEEKFQAALQELKAVKSSEAIAMENLKALIEKTMRNRAYASRYSPNITISMFEYEYLIGHATGAEEIADKKVAAAKAWIRALKSSEKEISMKIELSRRETRDLRAEERVVPETEESNIENEFENWKKMMERQKSQRGISLPSKAMNRSFKMRGRTFASPGFRGTPRSTSFTVKRRIKMIPNLAQLFRGRITKRKE